jgi:hypothetical protein
MAISVSRTRSARRYHTQQTHYLDKRFNFSDHDQAASGAGKICIGVLPAHSFPLECYVRINSSFTGANLIIGTSAAGSSAAVVSTADVAAGSTGSTIVDRYMGTYSTVDVPLYVQTKATGETIGQADVWLAYLPAVSGAT